MRIGPYRFSLKVSEKRATWWLRPASKASTVGAYALALLALVLHFL